MRRDSRYRNAIARAEVQAAVDVQLGIDNLRRSIETAPEFAETGTPSGGRRMEAVRGPLLGHLRRIEKVHG